MLKLAGVTLFFAARGIAAELHRVKSLLEIKNVEKEEDLIGEATEDGKSSFLLRICFTVLLLVPFQL